MNLVKPIIYCVLQLSFVCVCLAQQYDITRYADHNGLPVRIIRGAMQDSAGYLWIAGNNGLFKYDGKEFHAFYSPMNDTLGLQENKIYITAESSDGKIWIGTARGLHYYQNDSITHFQLFENSDVGIISIFEDRFENLWIGTYNGINVLNKSPQGNYKEDPTFRREVPKNTVWSFMQSDDDNIWIVTSKGTYLANFQKTPLVKKAKINFLDGLNEVVANIYKFQKYSDSLYIVDAEVGLLKGTLNSDGSMTVSMFKNSEGHQQANFLIYKSVIDVDKNIWIATYRNHIKKYQLTPKGLKALKIESKNGLKEMAPHSISIAEDKQNNIWVSNANGLFKFTKNQNRIFNFPNDLSDDCLDDIFSPSAITEDKSGNLWVSTTRGLYRLNKDDIFSRKCFDNYFFTNKIKHAWDLHFDQQNRLWLSSQSGLHIIELDEQNNPKNWLRFGKENGIPHDFCYEIHEKDANTFWIGNYSGLVKASISNGDHRNIEFDYFQSDIDREGSLVNSWVQGVAADKDDNIWAATSKGLSQLQSESKRGIFQNYLTSKKINSLSNNSTKQLFKDQQGNLWIGTQSGLNLYQKETNDFLRFGREKGLPSEYILGIQQDSKGNLWLATTNGLFRGKYDLSCQCFQEKEYYKREDGLADNITNRNAFYIDKNDNVFIGSSKGLSVLKNIPTSSTNNKFNLALTNFKITQNGKSGFANIKGRIINNNIELSHYENSIQLGYAVLDLSNPAYNKYRHKLLPVNDDWVYTENQADLTFYNLNPGSYDLILDGTNRQGIWSKDPIRLNININPSWYFSKLAYIFYGLLAIVGLRILYLWRVGKKLRVLQEKANLDQAVLKEKVQLRKENAADFHDELGSRVTKISLYLTLAERSLKKEEDASNWFSKIRNNVTDLSGMFRDLLWVIDPEKDSLSETFFRLKEFGEELFPDSNVMFRTYGEFEKQTDKQLDAQTKKQVLLIFKEAMHNCVKYSEAEKVELIFTNDAGEVGIILRDNGIGFKIGIKGKGRGLKNMRARADKINAAFDIISGENGTSVKLNRIPYIRDAKD